MILERTMGSKSSTLTNKNGQAFEINWLKRKALLKKTSINAIVSSILGILETMGAILVKCVRWT